MNEKYTLTAAIELWKRWFDWRGNPYIKVGGMPTVCFFCDAIRPDHNVNCVYVTAEKLVALDEKGELR